jgi:hypothetical protein
LDTTTRLLSIVSTTQPCPTSAAVTSPFMSAVAVLAGFGAAIGWVALAEQPAPVADNAKATANTAGERTNACTRTSSGLVLTPTRQVGRRGL